MPPASHIELPERYEVRERIAMGGMASVWRAEDLLLGRIVAVKVLAPQYASDEGARARFEREARTAAQVSDHPNVVTIYDVGEHAERAYLVMEHFAGGTVAARLREARERGEPVERALALRWLREAAEGLQVAHAAGIVHRDVKPANLLLDADGRLAVADFGIARLADDTQMTATGQVLGTAAYLSPEQALGRPATAASDRYALAVVAHELLTGTRPFTGEHPTAQARQHAEDPPPRASAVVPGLPAAVDDVLVRGLAKDPAERPKRATTFVEQLTEALDEPPAVRPAPEPEEPPTQVTRPVRRSPLPVPVSPPVRTPDPPTPSRPARPAARTSPAAVDPTPTPMPERASRGRPDRTVPIALGLLAVLVVGVLVALLAGGGDDAGRSSARAPRTSTAARTADSDAPARRRRTTPAEPATGAQTQQAAPPAQTGTPAQPPRTQTAPQRSGGSGSGGGDPAALNDRGFALSNAGDYAGAVAPLQASVQGFRDAGRTDDITYAFALYNLGVALNRSGNSAAAIPVLQERLKYANQRDRVQAELDDAMGNVSGGGKKAKPGKSKGKGGD